MADIKNTDDIEDILKNLDDLLQAKTLKAVEELQKEIDTAIKKSGDELKQIIQSRQKES